MRFNLSSTALSSRLLTLSRVINSKNSLPILDCFLFEIHNRQLTITASDSENVMRGTLNLEDCEGEGDFAVNNHTILDAVKELPEQPLALAVNMEEMKIYVTYQNGSYNFPIMSAEEYPRVQPMSESATTVTIGAAKLSDSLTRSLFATAQDELRPVMNGVYFDLKEDGLAVVASDGHKLVRNKIFTVKSETPASFVLPKKPATLLKNVLSKDGGDVIIRFDDRSAEVSFAEGNLACRLIEGKYPNYNSVIPQDNPNKVTVDRVSLLMALKRVSVSSNPASGLVKLQLLKDAMMISAQDIDFSTSAEERVMCQYEGMDLSIGFKGTFLIEILSNINSGEIVLELADPSRAGVVVPVENEPEEELLMLLMPMVLND